MGHWIVDSNIKREKSEIYRQSRRGPQFGRKGPPPQDTAGYLLLNAAGLFVRAAGCRGPAAFRRFGERGSRQHQHDQQ